MAGAAERVNQTLFDKLWKLWNFNSNNWNLQLKRSTDETTIHLAEV